MLKKKMDRIDALQSNINIHKEPSSTTTASNSKNPTRRVSLVSCKKKSDNDKSDSESVEEEKQQNLFTERYFTPNENLGSYMKDHKHKKGIVITARVHPGESNSSFIAEGIITFLLGNSREAIFLRNNFVFKIIPMINPDGVIYGNYR
jgi:murein tripeptide amidase MpaA